MSPFSIYIHIPFCIHRCAYCDFNTYSGQQTLIPAYVDALCKEIEYSYRSFLHANGEKGSMDVPTIFFGGGTPSLLSTRQYEKIMQTISGLFHLVNAEISIEANPGTVTRDSLKELRALGINRISLGVQSSHAEELHQLERIHNYYDVINAVSWARGAGFSNLNIDLIYGLPEQELGKWIATVKRVVDLHPEHLSLYALSIEHGTPFGRWESRGMLPTPDPDKAADMYEWAGEYLESHGYVQYEISNWAFHKERQAKYHDHDFPVQNPSFSCKHNLTYWRGLPYLGYGAGAHGYAGGYRVANALRIGKYIEKLKSISSQNANLGFPITPTTVTNRHITKKTAMQETMMTGLRLTREGVSAGVFEKKFGEPILDVFGNEINDCITLGLLEWRGEVIRLTRRGRMVGNQVFLRFVD
jgi:oxygen-independent coproporphyrinogen III oxidase